MNQDEMSLLKNMLTQRRVATVAVLLEGEPYTGLLPFAVQPDFLGFLVHASTLAKHTQGLLQDAPFSLMIHEPERPELDPLQMARVSFQGKINRLEKGSDAYLMAQAVYQAKFPESAGIFSFQDFNLYSLMIERARFVAAFGRIFNLSPGTMRSIARPGVEDSPDE